MADSFFHDKTEHLPATYLGKNSQSISPPIVREKKDQGLPPVQQKTAVMEHVHDCRFDSTAQAGLKIHGQQIAGPGHVGADLGHQGIGGVETLLVAQAGHEVQAQLAAVEVQIRIQQEALDAQAVIPEGGLAADELVQAGGADHMPAYFHRRQLVHVKAVLLA